MVATIVQVPFDPKNWSILPISIIAVGFLVYIGVWAAKQLGIVKPKENGHLTARQELEVRGLIDSMCIMRGEPGGLHYLNNKLRELLWWKNEVERDLKIPIERRKSEREYPDKDSGS